MNIILPSRKAALRKGWIFQVQWIEGGSGNPCFFRCTSGAEAEARADKLRRMGKKPVVVDLRDALRTAADRLDASHMMRISQVVDFICQGAKEQTMPTDDEINAAIEAFAKRAARQQARRALPLSRPSISASIEAAERERILFKREHCRHERRTGTGSIMGSGAGSYSWWCPDCGQSGESEWLGRADGPPAACFGQ